MQLVIKNGTIINADQRFKADIAVDNGKIVEIAEKIDKEADKVIDAAGKYVLPGGVEPHCHISVPFFGTVSCDDYSTGSRAAAFGGTTTIIDFATQIKGESLKKTAADRREMGDGHTYGDYSFHLIITDPCKEVIEEIPEMVEQGLPSMKVYMVYRKEGLMTDDAHMIQLMRKTRTCGALLSVHAENPDVIDMLTDEFMAEGKKDPWHHYLSRPEYVASEAALRVMHWAKAMDAPLYIVHNGDKETIEAIEQAKAEGYPIYAETCPQYLHFTCDVYKRDDGARFICSPPMKGQESQDALWRACKGPVMDTLGSDHCPFIAEEKDADVPFPQCPNGMMGIETRYPYILSEALKGRLSLERAVALGARNPARIFGCTNKGMIAVGMDGDFAILDPQKSYIVSMENNHSAVDHTVWAGYENQGHIDAAICRGQVIVENDQLVGDPSYGKFVERAPFDPDR